MKKENAKLKNTVGTVENENAVLKNTVGTLEKKNSELNILVGTLEKIIEENKKENLISTEELK